MSELFIFLVCIIIMCVILSICSAIKTHIISKQNIYVRTIERINKLPREYGEHYVKTLVIYKEADQYVIMYKPGGFVTRGDTIVEAADKMYNKLKEFNVI